MKCDWQQTGPAQWTCRRCGAIVLSTTQTDGTALIPPLDQLPPCGHQAGPIEQVVSYAKALRRWIAAGRPTRPPGEIERIYAICTSCNRFDAAADRCRLCGCRVDQSEAGWRNKIAMATESCPLRRW